MCDAFRQSIDWQFLTGGQWVSHPSGIHDYKVNIIKKDDPIMEGIEDFDYPNWAEESETFHFSDQFA